MRAGPVPTAQAMLILWAPLEPVSGESGRHSIHNGASRASTGMGSDLKRYGRHDWTRTSDLYRVKVAL